MSTETEKINFDKSIYWNSIYLFKRFKEMYIMIYNLYLFWGKKQITEEYYNRIMHMYVYMCMCVCGYWKIWKDTVQTIGLSLFEWLKFLNNYSSR